MQTLKKKMQALTALKLIPDQQLQCWAVLSVSLSLTQGR